MKILTMFCFTALLAGCAIHNVPPDDVGDSAVESGQEDTFIPNNDSTGDPGGCSVYIEEIKWPDGHSTYVVIPSLCDPLSMDKGDPTPDDVNIADEVTNPANVFQKK